MKKTFNQTILVNIFGAIGYVALVVVWVFALVVVATLLVGPTLLVDSGAVDPGQTAAPTGDTSLTLAVALYTLTAVAIVISIAAFFALPYLIGKWMSRFLRWTLKVIKVPASLQAVFFTKGLLISFPLMVLMAVYYMNAPIDLTLAAMFVATVVLAGSGLSSFLIQWVLARRLSVDSKKVW